jgi:hypothetical protein
MHKSTPANHNVRYEKSDCHSTFENATTKRVSVTTPANHNVRYEKSDCHSTFENATTKRVSVTTPPLRRVTVTTPPYEKSDRTNSTTEKSDRYNSTTTQKRSTTQPPMLVASWAKHCSSKQQSKQCGTGLPSPVSTTT